MPPPPPTCALPNYLCSPPKCSSSQCIHVISSTPFPPLHIITQLAPLCIVCVYDRQSAIRHLQYGTERI